MRPNSSFACSSRNSRIESEFRLDFTLAKVTWGAKDPFGFNATQLHTAWCRRENSPFSAWQPAQTTRMKSGFGKAPTVRTEKPNDGKEKFENDLAIDDAFSAPTPPMKATVTWRFSFGTKEASDGMERSDWEKSQTASLTLLPSSKAAKRRLVSMGKIDPNL